MKSQYLLLFLALLLVVSSCIKQNVDTIGPPPLPPTGETKSFVVEAKQYEFIPNTITVNEGDVVILKVKSTDVEHGFYLPEYNINKKLNPNEEVEIKFVANKKGTFTFRCNVPCGSGHMEMTGTLIVK